MARMIRAMILDAFCISRRNPARFKRLPHCARPHTSLFASASKSSAATSRLTNRSAQSSLRGYARGAMSPHHTSKPSITTTSSGSPPLASRTSQPRSGRVTRYQISRTPYDSCRSPVHRTVFVLCTGRRCYNHGRTAYDQSRTGGAAIDEGSQPWQYVPAPQRKTPAACSVPE